MQEKATTVRDIFQQLTYQNSESDILEWSTRKESENKNQEEYKKRWNIYLDSTDYYPDWFKETALDNIKSNKDIPDLNAEALSCTYDTIRESLSKKDKFFDIYRLKLEGIETISQKPKEQTNIGQWKKFEHASSLFSLHKSIENHGTGWVIAGENVSVNQCQDNDFYIYFSKDENEKYSIPRIFIRTQSEKVMEVGGVNKYQNVEPLMLGPVNNQIRDKLSVNNDEFAKKQNNSRELTKILRNVRCRGTFTKERANFIYQIDKKIEYFGFDTDPRVQEFISTRDIKKDLTFFYKCNPEQISLCKDEAMKGGIKVHYGDLNIDDVTYLEEKLPEIVLGSLYLDYIKSDKGFKLPSIVKGIVSLASLSEDQKNKMRNNYSELTII